jgi:mannose-6-phosphate isomerase-like protein (cupin superfamily)
MAIEVYDYRTDIRNVLVTPQIRARFIQIDVGDISGGARPGQGHSHDLGHEVFLVLQGQAEFEIEGETAVVGPGQMCVALVDEVHTVRNVGDEPVILYLSVTPHIQPTHTGWTEDGEKAPPGFNRSTAYDVPEHDPGATEALLTAHLDAVARYADTVAAALAAHRGQGEAFRAAAADGDGDAARDARDAMWASLYPLFAGSHDLAEAWNAFTYRTAADAV